MKPYEFEATGAPRHECHLPPVEYHPVGMQIRCAHVTVIWGQEFPCRREWYVGYKGWVHPQKVWKEVDYAW